MRKHLADFLAVLGLGAVVYGVAQIFAPLAWIVGGLSSLAIAWLVARQESPVPPSAGVP